ncbi:NADPH oxidase 1 isoform X1 [Notechis scutatus]|uniref:NADPH oxidase 1 isoform X1 n=1 Tax=Notechis scutatus TaxID=8663 RepID=A0A6J1UHW1_9SAUR|nr:NADPH oxidase 1 isoform X1 [Notechis scutatus]
MGNWAINHWFSALVIAAWLALNIYLFLTYFLIFDRSEQYYYTRQILGSALAWARASAKCLNFNSMLILLPICRNLLSFVRGTCRCCRRTMRRQLDHNLAFHKLVAYMIAIHTAIHIIAHLFNVEWYIDAQQKTDESLPSILSHLHKTNGLWLNPIQSNSTIPLYVAFTTIPGLTGVIITLALILMITSSMEQIRRSYFEVFWYTHHLFVIYFAGLVIHGIAGLVRGQTAESLMKNNPKKCAHRHTQWGRNSSHPYCEVPEFGSIPAESWKWVLAPIILYAFERALRIWRSCQKVDIMKVIMHPSRVLEIQMFKAGFSMEIGQYVFLNCPAISYLEWHPFTLTSAPEENYFSVHIRVAGDWTETLIDTLQQPNSPMPRMMVDGPFGTASEDVFQYEVAMLVGAGIGVTPFASVLKSIWYKLQHGDQELRTRKIYFYWVCRETGSFSWFKHLLSSLEQEMEGSGRADFLSYHLYLTGWNRSMVGHAALHFQKSTDMVTGLRQKTSFGRPMWNNEFSAVAAAHPRSVVGVFLCGPEQLAKTLRKYCSQHSSLDPRNVQFYFNKENF